MLSRKSEWYAEGEKERGRLTAFDEASFLRRSIASSFLSTSRHRPKKRKALLITLSPTALSSLSPYLVSNHSSSSRGSAPFPRRMR